MLYARFTCRSMCESARPVQRSHMKLRVVFAILVLLTAANLFAASVRGIVRDDSGQVIPGVTITAGAEVAVTGVDGAFGIDGLKAGAYTLQAVLDGFQAVSKDIKLTNDQKLDIAFRLVPALSESITVTADAVKTGEVAILESRREAPVVSDSISSEEIRKTPDSTAASVVERLTGVTLLGDKYVFVRGLGERYSGTTINGSTVPTTETEKRVVPLDLFPAKLLDSVNVVKTYTPDKPGDFGSGVVEMTTTQFPGSQSVKLTVGTAYQGGTTGSDFRRYGSQRLSGDAPSTFLQRSSILNPNGFSPAELERIGETFVGDWTGRASESASPATDYALTYGNTFGRLGVVLSAVSNHGFKNTEEIQRYYGIDANGDLVPFNDYTLLSNRESTTSGFVGNVSLRLNDQHRLYLNSVLTRDAAAEDRFQEGLQTNSGGDIRDYRVRYQKEEVLSTRLRGDHNFSGPGVGSLLEWNIARSTATNDSDLRENIYRESTPGVFEMQTGFADSGKLEYFNLDDNVQQGGATYSIYVWSTALKAGVDRQKRTRDFGARRFRFVTSNFQQFDLTLTPDEIYTAANIRPNGFEIRETTGINDAYDAEHTVDAGFAMADVTAGKWRVIGGARYESSEQRVTTFNPFDTSRAVDSIHENNDVLPSLNIVRQLGSTTNLRFAYGRSLNRPEFRELSPFAFTEVAGGRSVSGNPDLVQATIDGLDFRWETFPTSGEVIAASLFYKRIDKPIERIVQPTTDFRQSFVNADSASLYGIELEFRRNINRLWSVNANYARIHSNVAVGEHQFSVVTNTERPLEGQSDNVGNLALQFYHPEWGTMFRILGSYSGKRLIEVGAFGLPDTYEAANTSIDAVISQSLAFARGLELKLAASNLLDEKREFLTGGAIQRSFDPGRKVSLSLSYTPF